MLFGIHGLSSSSASYVVLVAAAGLWSTLRLPDTRRVRLVPRL